MKKKPLRFFIWLHSTSTELNVHKIHALKNDPIFECQHTHAEPTGYVKSSFWEHIVWLVPNWKKFGHRRVIHFLFFRLPNRNVVSKLMEWIEIGIVNILLNVICKSENGNGNGNGKKYVKWRDNVLNDIYKRCLVENILNVLEFKLILFKYV